MRSTYKLRDLKPGKVMEEQELVDTNYLRDFVFSMVRKLLPENTVVCHISLDVHFLAARDPMQVRSWSIPVKVEEPNATEGAEKPTPNPQFGWGSGASKDSK